MIKGFIHFYLSMDKGWLYSKVKDEMFHFCHSVASET